MLHFAMPFIAIDENSGERVVITKLNSPREELRGRKLKCQLCGERMYLRGGADVVFHFYHHRLCTSTYKSNPETPEHIAGKHFIGEEILPGLKDYADFKPVYEVPIPEIMRVADVMLAFNMGWRIAHEIQLSAISIDELDQRTTDYLAAGIDVLWWFGKSADTRTNRQWAIQKYGFSLSLSFEKDQKVDCGLWIKIEGRDALGMKVTKEVYRPNSDVRPGENLPVLSRVASWWLEHAFFRYYQTWQRGNNDLYFRAFGASKRTIASFNGKTGASNGKWFRKNTKGDWVVDLPVFLDREEKHSKLKRLTDNVVVILKSRAGSCN
jgi:hypothetical protein